MIAVALQEENASLKQEILYLRQQIAFLKKQLFGSGRSEKLDAAQLQLKLNELNELMARSETPTERITYQRKKPGKRCVPAEHFKDLPVNETVEILPDEVKSDPQLYQRIGQEETFEVDILPPRLFKRLIILPKFKHKLDRSLPPVSAPAPKRPVEGGYASAGLLAWVVLSKYVDHLPLYRQEKMSKRWGAQLSRKTLADWVEKVAFWLKPIYNYMREDLIKGGYIQADETPIKYNDPDVKNAKTSQGWLWVISRPGGEVVFDWRLSRRHSETATLLQGFSGLLQADGYDAYVSYEAAHEEVTLFGCWAHARRKFVEALSEAPGKIQLVLPLIGHLFHYEEQWDRKKVRGPKLRAALRQSHANLTLTLLKKVILKLSERALPKSGLGKACTYALNQWERLVRYLQHGQVRIDNNLVENAIRPSAIGKRNWLFIGHPEAGQRSAIIYSIVVSCQRHGIDPLDYLKDVLTRLPGRTNQDPISPLTPANWKNPNP